MTARNAQIAELSRAGKYSEAIPVAQRLLADMETAHGPVHRDVAASLNNLALLYGDQGRDADAEPLYKRALTILEKVTRLAIATVERLNSDPTIGRAEALPQALTGYLGDSSSPKNAYPAFWGPFALIGEARHVKNFRLCVATR